MQTFDRCWLRQPDLSASLLLLLPYLACVLVSLPLSLLLFDINNSISRDYLVRVDLGYNSGCILIHCLSPRYGNVLKRGGFAGNISINISSQLFDYSISGIVDDLNDGYYMVSYTTTISGG
eukprot:750851-Hanusia_phi.AAC.1